MTKTYVQQRLYKTREFGCMINWLLKQIMGDFDYVNWVNFKRRNELSLWHVHFDSRSVQYTHDHIYWSEEHSHPFEELRRLNNGKKNNS